jgi:hypothetical protein
MGSAPASGAVFRALAENIGRIEISKILCPSHTQEAGREAHPATPVAGVLPTSKKCQLKKIKNASVGAFHPLALNISAASLPCYRKTKTNMLVIADIAFRD